MTKYKVELILETDEFDGWNLDAPVQEIEYLRDFFGTNCNFSHEIPSVMGKYLQWKFIDVDIFKE